MRRSISYILIAIFVVLLSSCGPKLHGTVFLDENGNNTYDEGETYLGNVNYTVTLGGKQIAGGISDPESGSYSVKATEDGTYCVELKPLETQTPTVDISLMPSAKTSLKSKSQKSVGMKAASSDDKEDGNADPDGDGIINDMDNDDDGDGVSDTFDNCQYVQNPGQEDEDDDGKGDLCDKDDDDDDDDDSDDGYLPVGESHTDGKSCIGKKGFSSVTLDVPVKKTYDMSSFSLSAQEVYAGEPFDFELYHPEACGVKPFTLPAELQLGEYWSPDVVNEFVNLSLEAVDKTPPISSSSIAEENIVGDVVKMIANPDIFADEGYKEVTVTAEAICPDGTKIPLSQTVKINEKFSLKFSPELGSQLVDMVVGNSSPVVIKYNVVNESNRDYNDIEVTISVPPPWIESEGYGLMVDSAKMVQANSNCDKAGTSATCKFSLKAGKNEELKINFEKPDQGGEYTVGAQIKLPTMSARKIKETITFNIKEPEEEEEQQ